MPNHDDTRSKELEAVLRAVKSTFKNLKPEELAEVKKLINQQRGLDPDRPSRELELREKVRSRQEKGDWETVEASLLEILTLDQLTDPRRYKAHADLAALYDLLGRANEALDQVALATAAARPAGMGVLTGMALRGEARLLVRHGRSEEARALIEEDLALIGDDSRLEMMRGFDLTILVHCDIAQEEFLQTQIDASQLEQTQRKLDEAFALLKPRLAEDLAGGLNGVLAYTWSVQAKLHAQSGDLFSAGDAWREAVSQARQADAGHRAGDVYSRSFLAEMLAGLADALTEGGQDAEAAAARAESREILRAIGLPTDGEE